MPPSAWQPAQRVCVIGITSRYQVIVPPSPGKASSPGSTGTPREQAVKLSATRAAKVFMANSWTQHRPEIRKCHISGWDASPPLADGEAFENINAPISET